MRKKKLYLAILTLIMASCASGPSEGEQRSFIAFQPCQISNCTSSDPFIIMAAISKTLKEEGFIIKAIHYDLGFVSASKNIDKELAQVLVSEDYNGILPNALDITANLFQEKGKMKVKIHFVSKFFDQLGVVHALEMVGDQEIYHRFFEKIRQYLEITKEE